MAPPLSTNALPASEIPNFPWPPPEASATANLPPDFFKNANVIGDVNKKLSSALLACEYADTSYYAVPGGFALVTRLEQINADGTPKLSPDRWSVIPAHLASFNLADYIKALFGANPGRFRIIVFIVTQHPFSQATAAVSREEAMAWLPNGLNKLPTSIAQEPYSAAYTCTALVYEFELPETKDKAFLNKPSPLAAQTHLSKARLWAKLEQ